MGAIQMFHEWQNNAVRFDRSVRSKFGMITPFSIHLIDIQKVNSIVPDKIYAWKSILQSFAQIEMNFKLANAFEMEILPGIKRRKWFPDERNAYSECLLIYSLELVGHLTEENITTHNNNTMNKR